MTPLTGGTVQGDMGIRTAAATDGAMMASVHGYKFILSPKLSML